MNPYSLLRPLLFTLDAEKAHRAAIMALRLVPQGKPRATLPALAIRVAGIDFPTPIGLAAGFDKDAQVPDAMLRQGFGFVEVGTLTPQPQAGNPRPRLFRLAEDKAVINRMGFNNGGQAAALERLLRRYDRPGIVGVNIGANKDAADRVTDYVTGVTVMRGVARYLTVNISSPNTPGLRALQSREALDELLAAVVNARGRQGPPIFLKVAPDLAPADVDDIAEVALRRGIDGLIVSNTTIARPPLKSMLGAETGGLSGAPLHDLALRRLIDFRAATAGHIPLIAAGGVASADQAYARILAGASLVQIYSALVYEGPGLARRISDDLVKLLARDGFACVADAVGAG